MAPASNSIKFNSPAAVSNFFGASNTILSSPSLVYVAMDFYAASAIVDNILNAYASAASIFCNSSSVASATISTKPWMIQLTAPASDYINFNFSDTIYNLLCASASVLITPYLILSALSLVSARMGASDASVIFDSILSASASTSVIFFAASSLASIFQFTVQ